MSQVPCSTRIVDPYQNQHSSVDYGKFMTLQGFLTLPQLVIPATMHNSAVPCPGRQQNATCACTICTYLHMIRIKTCLYTHCQLPCHLTISCMPHVYLHNEIHFPSTFDVTPLYISLLNTSNTHYTTYYNNRHIQNPLRRPLPTSSRSIALTPCITFQVLTLRTSVSVYCS